LIAAVAISAVTEFGWIYRHGRTIMRAVHGAGTMIVSGRASSAVIVLGLLLLAGAAPAQDVAAWRVECTGDGKSGAMIIQLPLGLNLTEPITVKVDNGISERQPIQTCTNVGCFAALTANERLVTSMRNGTDLKITFQDANKKPVELAVPLLGFGVAFDKVRT